MAESTIWWVIAGTVVAVELLSGTFYLLMLSLGLVAAAIAATVGATVTVQLLVAAFIGGGAVLAWRAYKQKLPSDLPASVNHDVNMDIGEIVHVNEWKPDGTSTVKYRGTNWQVSVHAGDPPSAGSHRIVEVIGNRLIVKKM